MAPASFVAARGYASDAKASPTEVSSILEQRIRGVQEESGLAETGRVLSVGYVDSYINSNSSSSNSPNIYGRPGEEWRLILCFI